MVAPPVFILGWYKPILRQCGYLWAPGPGPDAKEGGRRRTSRRWMGRMASMGLQALLLTSTIVLLCHFVLTELASWNCITWASSLLVSKAVLHVAVPSSSPSSPFFPAVTCSQEGEGLGRQQGHRWPCACAVELPWGCHPGGDRTVSLQLQPASLTCRAVRTDRWTPSPRIWPSRSGWGLRFYISNAFWGTHYIWKYSVAEHQVQCTSVVIFMIPSARA